MKHFKLHFVCFMQYTCHGHFPQVAAGTLDLITHANDKIIMFCVAVNYFNCTVGSLSGPERVSPPVVFLTPPEKLVLEVRTRGGYDIIVWNRVGDNSFRQNLSELVNFHEIFVRQPTTTSDYETYRASYSEGGGAANILVVPTGMNNI